MDPEALPSAPVQLPSPQHLSPTGAVILPFARKMYAAEKLNNFRWISKLVATYSNYTLTGADLVPEGVYQELAELGQFAEIAYSAVPIPSLIEHRTTLMQPLYPLQNYDAFQDCILVDSLPSNGADVPAYIVFRPSTRQLIVSVCGTSSLRHALQDVRAIRTAYPSGLGEVHSGFWDLYNGIKDKLLEGIRRGFKEYSPVELVLTGHSMGGSLSYLLCMDILADKDTWRPSVSLKIAAFGAPRTGDTGLVDYFRGLVVDFQQKWGEDSFKEYSVKGFNDGVPALPPAFLGYRHFCKEPLYTVCGQIYKTPASECEHALFHTLSEEEMDAEARVFPKGGHNYYNGRDLERFSRRIGWLLKSDPAVVGWEDRYLAMVT